MKSFSTDVSAVRVVDYILTLAIKEHASDVHFEPSGDETAIRIRVDGKLHRLVTLRNSLKDRVVSRLKVMSGMDITERRAPQDGSARLNEYTDIRVSVIPTVHGEKAAVRILDKRLIPQSSKDLGIKGESLTAYKKLLHAENGLILICGPTGSGKTSTMYETLRELADSEKNIVTLEDPVEYNITGINQIAINNLTGMTFDTCIKAVLRQDPDIIAIGEIRDEESAKAAYLAAASGRLTVATVHTPSAALLPDRMESFGINTTSLGRLLHGVIIQRLVVKIPQGRTGVFGIAALDGDKDMPARLTCADEALKKNCRDLIVRGVITEAEAERALGYI